MMTALALLAHVGPHAGGGHGGGALAVIAIVVLVGGWIAVAVAAWLFLRARVDSPEPPDTRAQARAQPPAQGPAKDDREPEPPPAYG